MDKRAAARSVVSCAEHHRADNSQNNLNDFNFIVSWWLKFKVECSEKKKCEETIFRSLEGFNKLKLKSSLIVHHIMRIRE